MLLKFDVFGVRMSVQRKGDHWLLFKESDTGLRARVYDVVIPDELNEQELTRYLADIYHEWARDEHLEVKRLS